MLKSPLAAEGAFCLNQLSGSVGNDMSHYNPLNKEILAELQAIVGERFVLTESDAMEPFSQYAHMPEAVVKPENTGEIAAIMSLANKWLFPVTPRGAGSGLSGGAVPRFGGIVLTFERMNRIIEVDTANMMAVVEPGVVTNDINDRVKEFGLYFAGYPMSLETCYVGGNVAENAGGGKAVKYGVTERYILGLEFVTPTGEIVQAGGKRIKDVTGYNLRRFLVGSEGTLGIITKVIIKLLPLPKAAVDLFVLFPDTAHAIAAVPKIITRSGIVPTAIEFMDRFCLVETCTYLNETINLHNAGAALLIEVDGPDEQLLEKDYDILGGLCVEFGAIEVYIADNYTTRERLWRIRRNLGEALLIKYPTESVEDMVVPTARIPEMMEEVSRIAAEYNVLVAPHGHAGDGNIHANIIMPPGDDPESFAKRLPLVQEKMYLAAHRLGGTISGEHGIGHKRLKFMHIVTSEAEMNFMRAIKCGVDPNNILNPGKIIEM